MAPSYDFHIFICQNQRAKGHPQGCCLSKGSDKLLNYMKTRVKELGIKNIRINKSGCLDQCKNGPVLVIYPEGTWYSPQCVEEIEEIIQCHLLKGKSVERLLIK